jgi:propanediol dehydratase small subunit
VTISHLLLKNHVADLIGRSAYALVTESAAAHLGVPLERALPIIEEYDHYAPVRASVLTLS